MTPSDTGVLTGDEIDLLLGQLIAQRAPDRPSDEEAAAVVRWAEDARMRSNLLNLVLGGDAQVVIGPDGEPSFRMTPERMAKAEHLMATNRSAAEFHARLVATALGNTAVPEPENKQ